MRGLGAKPLEKFWVATPFRLSENMGNALFNFVLAARPYFERASNIISGSRICTFTSSQSYSSQCFSKCCLNLGQTGPISLFADLVLPEKFPSTDCFIQSTTIRSSHTLYAVLSIQARVGETNLTANNNNSRGQSIAQW